MRKVAPYIRSAPLLAAVLSLAGCQSAPHPAAQARGVAALAPASDPGNSGGWVLNPAVSDEFDGAGIDHAKWFVQGIDGKYYIWKGRAPSQFAAHNVIVENGLLKLRSRWEPDFPFAKEDYAGATYGDPVAPVTTAAVVSKQRFLNGYMEVRSKAAKAAMTSSFWMIGYQSELDVYEQMGAPKKDDGTIQGNTLNAAIHDWRPGRFKSQFGNNKTFNNKHKLDFNVADEFHVYGVEWDEDYLKLYLDGKLIKTATRAEIGKGWVLTNPLEIWLDSEIFRWLGYPDAKELPADYEVDYVRVWQKPSANLLDRAFYGFEGPLLYQDQERPLNLVPESSEINAYQKFWHIDGPAKAHFSIVEDSVYAAGKQSLRFAHAGAVPGQEVTIVAPEGSVKLGAGKYQLSMKVFLEEGAAPSRLMVSLDDPGVEIPLDLSRLEKGKWVEVRHAFTRAAPSAAGDRMRIRVRQADLAGGPGTIYLDNVAVTRASP